MLVIQLDKFDCEFLYKGDYFRMIDERDGTVYDDKMIAEIFTDNSHNTPLQNFHTYMFNMRSNYLFYDLENLQFITGGYLPNDNT